MLTAKHCVFFNMTVTAGHVDVDAPDDAESSRWRQVRIVEEVAAHPQADVAVLKLEEPFNIISGYFLLSMQLYRSGT